MCFAPRGPREARGHTPRPRAGQASRHAAVLRGEESPRVMLLADRRAPAARYHPARCPRAPMRNARFPEDRPEMSAPRGKIERFYAEFPIMRSSAAQVHF